MWRESQFVLSDEFEVRVVHSAGRGAWLHVALILPLVIGLSGHPTMIMTEIHLSHSERACGLAKVIYRQQTPPFSSMTKGGVRQIHQ